MKKSSEWVEAIQAVEGEERIRVASPKEDAGQGFAAFLSEGVVNLQAPNSLSLIHGISQIRAGIKSGHLPDYLGESVPRFPLRPLWIGGKAQHALSSRVSIALPEMFDEEKSTEKLCRRLIEQGYNAILIGSRSCGLPQKRCEAFSASVAMIKAYGLRVIVQPTLLPGQTFTTPSFCPLNLPFQERVKGCLKELFDAVPEIDGIFWESFCREYSYFESPEARDATSYDLALAEMRLLEENLPEGASLIYYRPSVSPEEARPQSQWFSQFLDDAGPRTAVGFPAFHGEHPHPLWSELRKSPDSSATPLVPIVSLRSYHVGDQKLPYLQLDAMQQVLSRCQRHRFAGVIARIQEMPASGDFFQGNLWLFGQALWRNLPLKLLAETWFSAFEHKISMETYFSFHGALQQIAADLRRSEEGGERNLSERIKALWHSLPDELKEIH